MMRARTPALMLQGTGSDVGKSLLVAGLGRALKRRGLAVRPFKPQNMSNNAAVTEDGGEIGRAQALQARACGVRPVTDMNPVLLKPQSERGAQIVVEGRIFAQADARNYHALKPEWLPRVLASFERLRAEADLVLVEGAGAAARRGPRLLPDGDDATSAGAADSTLLRSIVDGVLGSGQTFQTAGLGPNSTLTSSLPASTDFASFATELVSYQVNEKANATSQLQS